MKAFQFWTTKFQTLSGQSKIRNGRKMRGCKVFSLRSIKKRGIGWFETMMCYALNNVISAKFILMPIYMGSVATNISSYKIYQLI